MNPADFAAILKLLRLGLQYTPLRSLPVLVRHHIILKSLGSLHSNIINLQKLSMVLTHSPHNHAAAKDAAERLCSTLALFVQELCLDRPRINCCLKLFSQTTAPDRVLIWARSQPEDGRARYVEAPEAGLVSKNTVWAALLGRYDGITQWRKGQHTVFVCNDLKAEHPAYFCSGVRDFMRYYNAVLVFSLGYMDGYPASSVQKVLGFLQFDSPKQNAFWWMPNTLDLQYGRNNVDAERYRERLERSAVFYVGSVMSAILGPMLKEHAL